MFERQIWRRLRKYFYTLNESAQHFSDKIIKSSVCCWFQWAAFSASWIQTGTFFLNENETRYLSFSVRLTLSTYELVFTVLLRPLHHQQQQERQHNHQQQQRHRSTAMTKVGKISYKVVIPSLSSPSHFYALFVQAFSIFVCLSAVPYHFVCDSNSLV